MINILYSGSSSACFELQNTVPYFSPELYTVRLNGEVIIREGHENVFSVFDLSPETSYDLEVQTGEETETMHFTTKAETCCINVRDFGAVGDGI
ncbi:MAG: hypothetical protein IKR11_08705, partial [Solobacterium sp.]|nr:hypothetical protein [Solobacterium sp.]